MGRRSVVEAEDAEDGSVAAALLLQQLDVMETAKAKEEERHVATQKLVQEARKRCDEAKTRVALATTVHADAEDVADKAKESNHGTAISRACRLRQANGTLLS